MKFQLWVISLDFRLVGATRHLPSSPRLFVQGCLFRDAFLSLSLVSIEEALYFSSQLKPIRLFLKFLLSCPLRSFLNVMNILVLPCVQAVYLV